MTFPGHAYGAEGPEAIAAISAQEHDAVAATVAALAARGIDVPVRSIGSTPTAVFPDPRPLATELRAGNYVYNDMTQVRLGTAAAEDCALTVLGTVTSRPAPGRVILDCGSKALAAERMNAASGTFGAVVGHPELRVERLFEEHAILESDAPVDVPVGARLRVIPNHACTAANLHDEMLVVDDGTVEDRWTLDARGWA
jgi:D-serine deaminase-like pyridoxal phosphate-dependent protein